MFDIAVLLNVSRATKYNWSRAVMQTYPAAFSSWNHISLKNKYCMADLKVLHEEFWGYLLREMADIFHNVFMDFISFY